jgi:hypothetical protein
MTKYLAGFAFAAMLFAGQASASTVFGVGICGTFSNGLPNAPLSGTWTCPTAARLGISGVTTEVLVYNSDYSSGVTTSVTDTTDFTFTSAAGFQWASDNLTSTGGGNSTGAVCSSGAALNATTSVFGPLVLSGCYDSALSGFGAPVTVSFVNTFVGNAIQGTGYAEIIYGGDSAPLSTPEPASSFLFLAGITFLGLGNLGLRRK